MWRRFLGWLRDTAAWLQGHPIPMAIVAAALLGGAVAGAPVSSRTYDYMWKDPRFCDDCHVHDYANQAWAKSVHARLTTCHDCHRVPIRHYPVNLFVAVFSRPQVPEDIPKPEVPVVVCEQCHSSRGAGEPLTGPMPEAIRAQVVHVDDSPLHRQHREAERRTPVSYEGGRGEPESGPIECLDCHGGVNATAHQFPATSEVCEHCHEGIRPKDEGGEVLSCLDCHARGFLGSADPAPAASAPAHP